MKINFDFIVSKAYEILILQNKLIFPIDVFNLKSNYNIKILSFTKMAELNNCSINDIIELSDGADAFKFERNNIILIVYNDKINNINRIRWSIAHEYGHIILNHTTQSDQNEIEANFFAANLLLPGCILKELKSKRDYIDLDYLKNKFSISHEAASKFFSNINSKGFDYFNNEYDDIIIAKADAFLKAETRNSRRLEFLEEEELQNERDSWLYE